ncbi:hypothetical protein Tcan_01437, partial [Toxocara canis]
KRYRYRNCFACYTYPAYKSTSRVYFLTSYHPTHTQTCLPSVRQLHCLFGNDFIPIIHCSESTSLNDVVSVSLCHMPNERSFFIRPIPKTPNNNVNNQAMERLQKYDQFLTREHALGSWRHFQE